MGYVHKLYAEVEPADSASMGTHKHTQTQARWGTHKCDMRPCLLSPVWTSIHAHAPIVVVKESYLDTQFELALNLALISSELVLVGDMLAFFWTL